MSNGTIEQQTSLEQEGNKQSAYGFSRLVAVEIFNVMSIKEARIEFDGSNIISITGYNDSGKSALTKSLEIVFYDEYKNDQSKFIHGKEEYMGIGLEFDDGVSINKYKYRNGNSLWEMLKDDEMIYTNQLGNTIAAMPTVPDPIKKYLRVIEDKVTGEKLNVRRNTDQTLLINTTGGQNYKIINAVLKLDVLSKAIERLNMGSNRLQSTFISKSSALEALIDSQDSINFLPEGIIEYITNIKGIIAETALRKKALQAIDEVSTTLHEIELTPELPTLDLTRVNMLRELSALDARVKEPVTPHVNPIDMGLVQRLQLLRNISNMQALTLQPVHEQVNTLDTTQLQLLKEIGKLYGVTNVSVHDEVKLLDGGRVSMLSELINRLRNVQEEEQLLTSINNELEEIQNKFDEASKTQGFKVCPNCKTIILDEVHNH